MLSLWFVPLLLFLLPPLRRRLLAPFRDDLVAVARLADLPQLAFFGQSRARIGDSPPTAVETILPRLRGAVVLRGDAGLGKTSALRWFAARSKRPVAFLAARDCALGVDVAIARLIHDVQETEFVRSRIHAGALMVIVDGLNEVSADTREKIGTFARDMSKGDVLVGTQPIEWIEPPGAKVVDLLPLSREEAERFLLSRPSVLMRRKRCTEAPIQMQSIPSCAARWTRRRAKKIVRLQNSCCRTHSTLPLWRISWRRDRNLPRPR